MRRNHVASAPSGSTRPPQRSCSGSVMAVAAVGGVGGPVVKRAAYKVAPKLYTSDALDRFSNALGSRMTSGALYGGECPRVVMDGSGLTSMLRSKSHNTTLGGVSDVRSTLLGFTSLWMIAGSSPWANASARSTALRTPNVSSLLLLLAPSPSSHVCSDSAYHGNSKYAVCVSSSITKARSSTTSPQSLSRTNRAASRCHRLTALSSCKPSNSLRHTRSPQNDALNMRCRPADDQTLRCAYCCSGREMMVAPSSDSLSVVRRSSDAPSLAPTSVPRQSGSNCWTSAARCSRRNNPRSACWLASCASSTADACAGVLAPLFPAICCSNSALATASFVSNSFSSFSRISSSRISASCSASRKASSCLRLPSSSRRATDKACSPPCVTTVASWIAPTTAARMVCDGTASDNSDSHRCSNTAVTRASCTDLPSDGPAAESPPSSSLAAPRSALANSPAASLVACRS
mmetsp:Transcript_55471/g.120891  ORF Transcript_55471/g.120891 Transcript_55471/m.120891 type:complete len:462 (-) Transcript_55471:236-1621(-)